MKKNIFNQSTINNCLNPDEKLITCVKGRIGRDCEKACVAISGVPFDDNTAFYKELNLIVITCNCRKKVSLKPGYNPGVFLFDFNGCGNEIYVTIDSGGSGGFQFFYIYEYYRCVLTLLINDDEYNAKYNNYKGMYLDYFRGQVMDKQNVWRLDLSCKGYEYLSQIYYADGKLIQPKEIYVLGANYTFPVFYQFYDRYVLSVYQEVTGLYHADTLGYMETIIKFEGSEDSVDRIYLKTESDKMCDCIIY